MVYETRDTQYGVPGYRCTTTLPSGKTLTRFFPHTRMGEYGHAVFREEHRSATNGRLKKRHVPRKVVEDDEERSEV